MKTRLDHFELLNLRARINQLFQKYLRVSTFSEQHLNTIAVLLKLADQTWIAKYSIAALQAQDDRHVVGR